MAVRTLVINKANFTPIQYEQGSWSEGWKGRKKSQHQVVHLISPLNSSRKVWNFQSFYNTKNFAFLTKMSRYDHVTFDLAQKRCWILIFLCQNCKLTNFLSVAAEDQSVLYCFDVKNKTRNVLLARGERKILTSHWNCRSSWICKAKPC